MSNPNSSSRSQGFGNVEVLVVVGKLTKFVLMPPEEVGEAREGLSVNSCCGLTGL